MTASTTLLHRIRSVRVIDDHVLELTWDDGTISRVDLESIIAQGGVFTSLAVPAVFASVSLDPGGRYLVWPGDIDLCADALRLTGESTKH